MAETGGRGGDVAGTEEAHALEAAGADVVVRGGAADGLQVQGVGQARCVVVAIDIDGREVAVVTVVTVVTIFIVVVIVAGRSPVCVGARLPCLAVEARSQAKANGRLECASIEGRAAVSIDIGNGTGIGIDIGVGIVAVDGSYATVLGSEARVEARGMAGGRAGWAGRGLNKGGVLRVAVVVAARGEGARLSQQVAAAVGEGAAVGVGEGVAGVGASREVLQWNGRVGRVVLVVVEVVVRSAIGIGHCSDQAPTRLSRRHARAAL